MVCKTAAWVRVSALAGLLVGEGDTVAWVRVSALS